MKRSYLYLIAVTILFASCKEKDPIINFSNVKSVDTTYVLSAIPAASKHNVLIEDFLGQSCSNCPSAHNLIETILTQNPGRVNVITLYVTDFPQTIPPSGAMHDFRDSIATQIEQNIYGPLYGMPIGGIDRLLLGTVDPGYPLQMPYSQWSGIVNNQLGVADSVNLGISSSYNSGTGIVTISDTVTYLQDMTNLQNISIAIVEDSLVDIQEDANAPAPGFDYNYNFASVFRTMVTSAPYGDGILPTMTTKEAGRVYIRTYAYQLNAAWVPKNCRVIAFLHHDVSVGCIDVYQSVQTPLAP